MKKAALLLILLSACGKYQPDLPETEIPVSWKQTVQSDADFPQKNRFWELFNDPVLNDLEEEAIRANFDLQIAMSRISEARALVKKEHAKTRPTADFNGYVEADETLINPRFFGSPHKLERVEQRQYNFLAYFGYELDLWGKLKAEETSARHREEAAEWEYEFVYQNVVTEVATRYISLRTLEEEVLYLFQAVEARKDTVDIYSCRSEAGCESDLNLSSARLELSLAEAQLEAARRLRTIEENALALLLGRAPSSWTLPIGTLPSAVPPVPAILPSEVVLRRADVQRELSLVAAGRSDVDVAIKDYFPSFPLTATLGLSSPALKHLFEWQARYWQYALNILAPLYDGGRRNAKVNLTKAAFKGAFASYQRTVNQAFQDVEDALSGIHYLRLQFDAQERALTAAQDTAYLAKDRFDSGLISYLLVSDTENTTLEVGRRTIALKGEQILAWIRLMRALGVQSD